MARKNTLVYTIATAQSLAANFTTVATIVEYLDNISYQIDITTSNSVGTFTVQASNDYEVNTAGAVVNEGTWIDLELGGGTPFANAANDNILISLNQVPFVAIRLEYTSSVAGTGTCAITLTAKQLGG